jgi:hypothetical protein
MNEHINMPMDEYLAMPAVSASLLKTLINQCPYVAWYQSWMNPNPPRKRETDATDTGSIAHGILLEGTESGVAVFDPADYPNKTGGGTAHGWTNNAIKEARDVARAEGKIPVLKSDMHEIRTMVGAARQFLDRLKVRQPHVWQMFQPDGGDSEVTMTWNDCGIPCRIRADRISKDRSIIVDYKTGGTTASPDIWGKSQMVRMGYYVSAAFYQRGVQAVHGVTPVYLWLVQEQEAPYLCSLVGLDNHAAALGAEKIDYALKEWSRCADSDDWPMYPADICYPEMPAWEDAQWIEKQLEETA